MLAIDAMPIRPGRAAGSSSKRSNRLHVNQKAQRWLDMEASLNRYILRGASRVRAMHMVADDFCIHWAYAYEQLRMLRRARALGLLEELLLCDGVRLPNSLKPAPAPRPQLPRRHRPSQPKLGPVLLIDYSDCPMAKKYGYKGRTYGSVDDHVSRAGQELRR